MARQGYGQRAQIETLGGEAQAKRKELERLCSARRRALEEALMFQDFLLSYYEAQQWIKERTATALDKTYLDLANLVTKIQRHQAFIGELKKGGERRVEGVQAEAAALLARHQSTALALGPQSEKTCAEIQQYVKDLNGQWNALKAATDSKRKCLEDAHRCVTFTRLCADAVNWCDEVAAQLASDDSGHDLSSCKLLLLRHEALSGQVAVHGDKVKELETQLAASGDNFMLGKMREAFEQVRQSFADLQEPALIRRDNLEESLALFTAMHDLDDSMQFVVEKEALLEAAGRLTASSLAEAVKLQKRHEQLESEVQGQQALVMASARAGRQLVERKHYASEELETRVVELEERWTGLRALCERRCRALEDTVQTQRFYAGCEELGEWVAEKRPLLASGDYGKDDLAALSNLKKLEVLMAEVEGRRKTECDALAEEARALLARDSQEQRWVII